MKTSTTVCHYSKALVQLAKSNENLEKTLADLEGVTKLLSEIPPFQGFLFHPLIKGEEKKKVLNGLFLTKISREILHFLFFLIDKKRIRLLFQITEKYHELVQDQLGIVEARVITAIPMEEAMKENIKAKLEKYYQKTIHIDEIVDSKIMGGTILMIANKMLDYSLKNQLTQLKDDLLAMKVK